MILLRANTELHQTFERLIEAMKVPVKWNGIFVVIDNYMILQGEVRSLFFHFDTRNVATNIIDIPVKEDEIGEVGTNMRVQNAINLILYAFGKWGTIKGVRVDKSFEQLNTLFTDIMKEMQVEPEYTPSYLRFYRSGMRITYEDVIQTAQEEEQTQPEDEETNEGGLWHKVVWKRAQAEFARADITVSERRKSRIGNNFYLVGYLCPACCGKLHMAVYPAGKEFKIETEEGGVLLARAATCNACRRFYTPRPGRLFSEGDIYTLDFATDDAAYDDYLELLGRNADRVSNYHTNVYADGRRPDMEEDGEESLEDLCNALPELSDLEVKKLSARMEEGFYPEESVEKYEAKVHSRERERHDEGRSLPQWEQAAEEPDKQSGTRTPKETAKQSAGRKETDSVGSGRPADRGRGMAAETETRRADHRAAEAEMHGADRRAAEAGSSLRPDADGAGRPAAKERTGGKDIHAATQTPEGGMTVDGVIVTPEERKGVQEHYEARLAVMDRYSDRQLQELKRQLEGERKLTEDEKKPYIKKIQDRIYEGRVRELQEKADACEGKNYTLTKRVLEEVEAADLPEEQKHPLREKLQQLKQSQAEREVAAMVAKMPANLDRKQYRLYVDRLHDYDGVDLTPYEQKIVAGREAAEKQELSNMIRRARKVSREDYVDLAERLREGDFLPGLVAPYLEKVNDRIRELDADAIAAICPAPMQMNFEEGIEAYQKIKEGDFLPELKTDALKTLEKRLSKIKADECELLVGKLKKELEENGVGENPRHHFYPARKVLLGQATPEETDVIEYAMASYAAGRGLFEYPILVVDVARDASGKEGMILTPEHLYYSTAFTSYGIPVASIASVTASTGLLNKGLYVHQKNGTKLKIPYAVGTKELPDYAGELDDFIHYLQEKPESRKLTYLASEKHDTICCFRCGYQYKGVGVCPKCGYQNNG